MKELAAIITMGKGNWAIPVIVSIFVLGILFPINNVYALDTDFLFKFGQRVGSGDGQFNFPQAGVTVDPVTQNIIVADDRNDRVQVFDSSGNFLFKFGSPGSAPSPLFTPASVAVDPVSQNIIMVDLGDFFDDPIIKVFDSSGNFISEFGSSGSSDGQFGLPGGLAVDPISQNIILSDPFNARVQVFGSLNPTHNVIDELNDIAASTTDPDLAEEITDEVVPDLQEAIDELTSSPPDNEAAAENIESVVDSLEDAIKDNGLDATLGTQLINQLLDIVRVLAVNAIDLANNTPGSDADGIAEANTALTDGDNLRASGDFEDAAEEYKDAIAEAEDALP